MNRVKLKPAPGLRVPNPATGQPLAEAGESVVRTIYWDRRIADGDVLIVTAKSKEA